MKSKYIDTNIFLNPIFYDDEKAERCKKLLKEGINGDVEMFTSFLTWDELTYAIEKKYGHQQAISEGKKFLDFPNLLFLKVDKNIIIKAQELISTYAIKPRDAIHAATAITNNINEIISDDSDFDKVTEIKRIKI